MGGMVLGRSLRLRLGVVGDVAFVLLGACLLSAPSLANGYPFLYVDSGFYILHGLFASPPGSFLWRPLTYSLSLKALLPFGGPLYFIFLQNFLLSGVLYGFVRLICPRCSGMRFLLILNLLYLTSFLPFSNLLMPDIFTGVMVIALGGVVLGDTLGARSVWWGLFLISVAMHYSNMVVGTLLALATFALLWPWPRWKMILPTLLLPWLALAVIHYSRTDRFVVSNSHQVYLYSQLTDLGVSQEYLQKTCGENSSSRLCAHRETIFNMWDWSPQSTIGRAGGLNDLLPEIERANREILGSRLLLTVLTRSLRRIGLQLLNFARPVEPVLVNAYLEKEIAIYSDSEMENFKAQRIRGLPVGKITNALGRLYFAVSLFSFLLLALLFARRSLDKPMRLMFTLAGAAYIGNATVCAVLTEVNARYCSRLVWIFPLLLFMWILGDGSMPLKIKLQRKLRVN